MKKYLRKMKNRMDCDGAAMSSVLIAVVVISGSVILAGVTATTLQWSAGSRSLADYNRAIAIAEAGPADAYQQISANYNLVHDPSAFGNRVDFGGGYYRNRVFETNGLVVIETEGGYRNARADVAVAFAKVDGDADDPPPPGGLGGEEFPPVQGPGPASIFDYSILAQQIHWGGTAGALAPGAWVHANQSVYLYGTGDILADGVSSANTIETKGNSAITGDAYAPVLTGKPRFNVNGLEVVTNVAPIAIPQIDFQPYRNWAEAHGEFFEHDVTINTPYTPEGGVLFVEGDLHITANGAIRGCFVATGDIHVGSQVRHSAIDGLPALMSDTGSIKINGGAELEGLIYTRIGDMDKLNGNAVLRGTIVCGGVLYANGTFDFKYRDSTLSPPWAPLAESGSEGVAGEDSGAPAPADLYLIAWQK